MTEKMGLRNVAVIAIAIVVVSFIAAAYIILKPTHGMKRLTALKMSELIRMARSGNAEERLQATLELSRRSRDATSALIERALHDEAEAVRIAALHAIAGMRDKAVDDAMLTVLRQERAHSPSEIEIAITHLSQSRNEATWRKLVELYFGDGSTALKGAAPKLFSRLNEAALRPICQMLGTGIAFKEPLGSSISGRTRTTCTMPDAAAFRQRQMQLLILIESVPTNALVALLSDNDIAVVVGALQLLLKFPTPDAATKLAELANSKHRIVRALAISALALKPSKKAAKEIKRLSEKGADKYVRACATVALASLGNAELEKVDRLLNSNDAIERKLALHALSNMNLPQEVMIERLRSMLSDADMEVRLTASMMLLRYGESGLKLFLKALEKAHGDERASMLLALRALKHKEVLRIVARDLTSKEPQVRWAAGVAISSHGVKALPVLSELLKHSDENVRVGALSALMQIGSSEAVKLIADAALNDSSRVVRMHAIEALSVFPGDERAVEALRKLLEYQDEELAMRAALVLGRFGQHGLKVLKGALKSKTPIARMASARVLAFYGDAESIRMLWDIARASDSVMKLAALQSLARVGDTRAMTELIKMLATGNEIERMKVRAAILGLGEKAVEPLKAALNDENELIRAEVALLLSQLRHQR